MVTLETSVSKIVFVGRFSHLFIFFENGSNAIKAYSSEMNFIFNTKGICWFLAHGNIKDTHGNIKDDFMFFSDTTEASFS